MPTMVFIRNYTVYCHTVFQHYQHYSMTAEIHDRHVQRSMQEHMFSSFFQIYFIIQLTFNSQKVIPWLRSRAGNFQFGTGFRICACSLCHNR